MKQTIFVGLAALLAACASAPPPPPIHGGSSLVDQQILAAAARVDAAQLALFRATALNSEHGNAVVSPVDATQALSVTWHGDAHPLLMQLAAGRGLAFQPMGARLPLPIALEVKDESFDTILDRVRSQVGYRATIDLSAHALTLQYNRPKL